MRSLVEMRFVMVNFMFALSDEKWKEYSASEDAKRRKNRMVKPFLQTVNSWIVACQPLGKNRHFWKGFITESYDALWDLRLTYNFSYFQAHALYFFQRFFLFFVLILCKSSKFVAGQIGRFSQAE